MDEEVVLLLGSNVGRRVRRLREGVDALSRRVRIGAVSGLLATAPAGRSGQPWFLNLAVRGTTELSPEELLGFVKSVEASAGRKGGARWGPRELDVDILLYGGRTVREPHLVIPHPGLPGRRFALAAAAQVAPRSPVPPDNRSLQELLERCGDPLEVVAL